MVISFIVVEITDRNSALKPYSEQIKQQQFNIIIIMKIANQNSTIAESIRISAEVMILLNTYIIGQGMKHKCETLENYIHSIIDQDAMVDLIEKYLDTLESDEKMKLRRTTFRYTENKMSKLRTTFIPLTEYQIDQLMSYPTLVEKLMALGLIIETNNEY